MLSLAFAAAAAVSASVDMNNDRPHQGDAVYQIANPAPGRSNMVPHEVAHRGKYIEVYSHNISTVYSEVYWIMQPSLDLPADFVKEFNDSIVAFTGYEADAVRIHADGSEEHVPLYDQYNHHHNAYVLGRATEMVDVGPAGSDAVPEHGGVRGRWEPRQRPLTTAQQEDVARAGEPPSEVPTGQFIVDGNGGEYRMSLHGTTKGTAMLVESPATFQIQPMMINTRNPNGKGPGNWDLYPAEAYGRARGATMPKNSLYSPLLECPCTDRKLRTITQHHTLNAGKCDSLVPNASACFGAAHKLGLQPLVRNTSLDAPGGPSGCYVTSTKEGYEAYYNAHVNSTTTCGVINHAHVRSSGTARTAVTGVGLEMTLDTHSAGCHAPAATSNLSGGWVFPGSTKYTTPYSVVVSQVQGKPDSYSVTGTTLCKDKTKPCVGAVVAHLSSGEMIFTMTAGFGSKPMNGTVSADWRTWKWSNGVVWDRAETCPGVVNITLSGPSNVWFGVGFDAMKMNNAYAIIVDGQGAVTERRMGDHDPGTPLKTSVTVLSSTAVGGVRTVVVTRALKGQSKEYASFKADAVGVPFISAVGSGVTLGYHRARTGGSLMLVETGAPLCVCDNKDGKGMGAIDGVTFSNNCAPAPRSTLATSNNDICDIKTYYGGLKCCSHKSILLDLNQTVPTEVDTYKMKFRLYYETYTNQTNAFFMFVVNEAGAGEYDIPQAKPGTPPDQTVYPLIGEFKVRDSMRKCKNRGDVWCAPGKENWNASKDIYLLRAGTHCHAPGCINETLYNLDTGKVICFNKPLYGKGTFPASGQHFDEEAYAVGIPPCYWGSAEEGLLPPPRLGLNTSLRSVKYVNNTYYHYGVMAQWQMRGTWAD